MKGKITAAGILVVFAFLVFQQGPGISQTKGKGGVAYVDMQFVFTSHPKSKDAMENLKKFQEARQADLDYKCKNADKLTDAQKQECALLAQKFQQEIEAKDKELTDDLFSGIKQAVEKIAKEQGYTMVLDKQMVYYGGTDITDTVVKALPK